MTFYPSALKLTWSGLLPALTLSLKISLYSILILELLLGFNRFGYASSSHFENRPSLKQKAISYQPLSDGIEKIDIVLADVTTKVDIERQGNKIILRLGNTKVEPGLIYKQHSKQRLLRSIYTDNKGKQGRIRIDIKQDFEYQSYQLGNKLTLTIQQVQRLTKPELTIKKYSGKPISVDFQNVEVRSVLHLLSQFMQTNIVASDEVTGTIMLNLINVPSDQALDIILSSKHLGKRVNGNVILVAPLAELAKQQENYLNAQQQKIARLPLRSEYIRLNYAKASEVHALILKASSQHINNRINSRNYIDNSGLESSHVNSNPTESDETSQLSSTSNSTLLSSRGVIAVDTRTNTLIVKDTADSINNIRMLISQIDIPVQQVMIEARIVSATDNFSKELGVKWGVLSNGVANNDTLLVGGSDQTLADLKQFSMRNTTFKGKPVSYPDYAVSRPDNLNIDLGIANPAGSIAFGILSMSDLMIDLELSAMQAEGRGEVISTPKILTLDKQTAKVSSGTKIPYQSESEGGGTTTQFEEALLSLEVTPNITPEGEISLQLNIENGRPNPVSSGVILIDTDRLSTHVTVADGQTIVLGGIYRNQIFNNVEKVPFFGDLPLLGRLFKKDLRRNDKQELLIFVTPTLIQKPQT
ncbi:type IV pilus secretin PilQ [Psychrobacter sanguinis]|uniref:type IV pilus secretin PilQ n=1 Tax=Psychrobacter sanguinis TaxID=861445 RepID=UPI001D11DCBC|nr:type IV pilus secretin PilQ [Psychrobacter sanguinis]MCC3346126.1 type IV pilus secretin PilQ [Psychrobacter sanguinis]